LVFLQKYDKTLVIGKSVTSIYDYAFLDCNGLTSVTISNPSILGSIRKTVNRDKIILTDEARRSMEETYRFLKEYKELYVCSKKDSYLIIHPIIPDIIFHDGYNYYVSANIYHVESKSGESWIYNYFTTDFSSLVTLKESDWLNNYAALTTQSALNNLQAYYNNTGKTSAFQKEYNSWKQRLIKDYGQNYGTKIANGILETGMTKSMVESMKKYYYKFKGSNTIVQGDVEYYEIITLTTPSKYISKVSALKELKFLNGKLIKISP
jgi:hypothetical protein